MDSINRYVEVIDLLMYYGQTALLLDAMRRAWPLVGESPDLMEWSRKEFGDTLVALEVFAYLDETSAPHPDDPQLLASLEEIGDWAPDHARLILESVLDRSMRDPGEINAALDVAERIPPLIRFSFAWLGDVYRRGVMLLKGELARRTLLRYLGEISEQGARGAAIVVPRLEPLDIYLRNRIYNAGDMYGVAALGELLLPYAEYLQRLGIVDTRRAHQMRLDLGWVLEGIRWHLEDYGAEPVVIAAIERKIAEAEPPADDYLANVPEEVQALLLELREAGKEPDEALLERVRAQGEASVQPLIAMATDLRLHKGDGESSEVWTPLHAIRLLGDLRAAEAVEPLLPLLSWDDDWLTTALQAAEVLPTIEQAFAEDRVDESIVDLPYVKQSLRR